MHDFGVQIRQSKVQKSKDSFYASRYSFSNRVNVTQLNCPNINLGENFCQETLSEPEEWKNHIGKKLSQCLEDKETLISVCGKRLVLVDSTQDEESKRIKKW